jgi:hypothetical protein
VQELHFERARHFPDILAAAAAAAAGQQHGSGRGGKRERSRRLGDRAADATSRDTEDSPPTPHDRATIPAAMAPGTGVGCQPPVAVAQRWCMS